MTESQATARFWFILALTTLAECMWSGCEDSIDELIDEADKRDLTNLTPTIEWGDEDDDAGCQDDAGTDAGCGDSGMGEAYHGR